MRKEQPLPLFDGLPPKFEQRTLEQARTYLGDCQRCRLSQERRTIVFGSGPKNAKMMLVGEGPGANEDRTGEPFVGRAGEVLDEALLTVGIRRDEVYITNCVKCRPPGNRDPQPDELLACLPFLDMQVVAIRPRVIVALGKFAAQYLLHSNQSIMKLRGRLHHYHHEGTGFNCLIIGALHPAYISRNPHLRKELAEDLRAALRAATDEVPY